MKFQNWLLILAIGIFSACQNKLQTKNDEKDITSMTKQTCYTYTKNKDTASLILLRTGHIVTGELRYQLFEKDKNIGLIKGEMRGDTLVADYTFASEGKESVRQIAFLEKDGKMIEGFGEAIEKDGKMAFKNRSTLKFGDAVVFTRVNCN